MTNTEPIDDPAIPRVLSTDRYATFLAACNGNQEQAVRLCSWNIAMSAALWGGFSVMEIALRNAMHDQLVRWVNRDDWWNGNVPLFPLEKNKIIEAVRSVSKEKGPRLTAGHVVADLTLGFWVKLLSNGYHQRLWVPALQYAFPNITGTRRDLHRDLERLRKLRNRIAHHEPIFARNLSAECWFVS